MVIEEGEEMMVAATRFFVAEGEGGGTPSPQSSPRTGEEARGGITTIPSTRSGQAQSSPVKGEEVRVEGEEDYEMEGL